MLISDVNTYFKMYTIMDPSPNMWTVYIQLDIVNTLSFNLKCSVTIVMLSHVKKIATTK